MLYKVFENNVSKTENKITLVEVQNNLLKSKCRQHSMVLQSADSIDQLLEFHYRFFDLLSV